MDRVCWEFSNRYIYPVNARRWPNVGLMLGHNLRRWLFQHTNNKIRHKQKYRDQNEKGVFTLLCWPYSTQQTQNICMTFEQCWTSVEDVGPTLYKCYTNGLCLLGMNKCAVLRILTKTIRRRKLMISCQVIWFNFSHPALPTTSSGWKLLTYA